jgi:fido (protein-threonine AMPylation protein)
MFEERFLDIEEITRESLLKKMKKEIECFGVKESEEGVHHNFDNRAWQTIHQEAFSSLFRSQKINRNGLNKNEPH